MTTDMYDFIKTAGRIINSDQSQTILLTGNIYDLFLSSRDTSETYVPLVDYLNAIWRIPGKILLVYELNGPIRFSKAHDKEKMRDAWLKWRSGYDADALAVQKMLAPRKIRNQLENTQKAFDENLLDAIGKPTVALELLRQMCLCSRTVISGNPILAESLIIIVEAADMVIPEGEISRLSDTDRHRISICHDWFSDPGFMESNDTVILLAESRALINQRIGRMPQIIEVQIGAPDKKARSHFIHWFNELQPGNKKLKLWAGTQELVQYTAGLSIHALMQLLKGTAYEGRVLTAKDVITKVEEYIQGQLGDDIVEFKKPAHGINDLIGFDGLKKFLKNELIPRFQADASEALPGAAVCGPIGSGKTFIFEAVAGELDMIVIVLKNIRSQWFGQTDVILDRLRRVLDALGKVLIFVDEADTQFGGVGPETHSTERRLTGKIQAMMSDTRLRGRVFWLLMTARIHLLSPDIRRPGRVGDLIIPILDPRGSDREAFIRWTISGGFKGQISSEMVETIGKKTIISSAAGFASLRAELKARASMKKDSLTPEEILAVIDDHIPPAIQATRRYQTLQALINCTRKSLLPNPDVTEADRQEWEAEASQLELKGIR